MTYQMQQVGDVCELITKGTTPTSVGFDYSSAGVPFLRVQNIAEGRVHYAGDVLYLELDAHRALKRSTILPGDLLVTIAGTIGRVGVVPDSAPEMNCNQAVAIIRLRGECNRFYVRHWFESEDARKQIRGGSVTGTIANLSLSQIAALKISLPPLGEQERIASILDQAESLRAKRRAALEQLDALAQAIFLEMFGEPYSNSRGWDDSETLGDVAEVVSGVTKGRSLKSTPTRVVPYLAVANVQDRHLALANVKEIEASEDEIVRYRLRAGDLLLTEGGDPDKLGRGSLWNGEIEDCIHQNHVFRVRLLVEHIRPVFLNWLVGSQRGKRYFLKSAKQTTGIASINMGQLKQFPLLVPPLELQLRFEQRLEQLRLHVEAQRRSLVELDALFASLQHRAFRGEL